MTDASADADVLVVCGPTAAGKSAVGLWLAERAPSVIVSADSRQVYRGFDVGTAKPTLAEQALVPHEGIDVADPVTRYSAAAWATDAEEWIGTAIASGRRPLVVGGTGLYLRALFEGLFVEPEMNPSARAALATELNTIDTEELRRWTRALDPARAHLGRVQLLRSVEIALLTGYRLSDLHLARPRRPRWRPRYLWVDPGAVLAERIERRIGAMFDQGWTDEVQRLMQTIPPDAPAWNATGYDVVRALVNGDLDRRAAHERILIDTRQYAKRQRTWFRHQLPADRVTMLDPLDAGWQAAVSAWVGNQA